MEKTKTIINSLETFQAIKQYLPGDHSTQHSLDSYVQAFLSPRTKPVTVLDLGCGEGDSVELFKRLAVDTEWYGVDIESSPEVSQRTRQSSYISTFNGVDLPYSDEYFDLIYCHQVLEHVRHPDALIKDALRVLKPNGLFIGSVSYLEPYHSYSIFNFTPYGIVRVFSDAGFEISEIRPGMDALALICRQLVNRSRWLRPIWSRSLLHCVVGIFGGVCGLDHRERNFLKIQFSGHLLFMARRPA